MVLYVSDVNRHHQPMNPEEYTQAVAAVIRYIVKHPDANLDQIRGAAEAHTRNPDKALEVTADAIAARGSAKQRVAEFGWSLSQGIVQRVRVAVGFQFTGDDGEPDQDCGTRVMILPTDSASALRAAERYAEAIGVAKGETCEVIEFEGEADSLDPIPA